MIALGVEPCADTFASCGRGGKGFQFRVSQATVVAEREDGAKSLTLVSNKLAFLKATTARCDLLLWAVSLVVTAQQ